MKIRIKLFSAITACFVLMSIVLPACGEAPRQNIQSAEEKEPIHLPNKIDFISQVDQTVKSLNNSPHILTIHHNSQDNIEGHHQW